jgi:hypothetical protein
VGRWHDATNAFENKDGRIGGEGVFDGGRTILVPFPFFNVWIQTQWKKSITPGATNLTQFTLYEWDAATLRTHAIPAGAEGAEVKRAVGSQLRARAALYLEGRNQPQPLVDERCLTNPIWMVPVDIIVEHPDQCPFPAGSVHVRFNLNLSMKNQPTGVFIRPLDANGVSTNPEYALEADPGWTELNAAFPEIATENGTYTCKNTAEIPCPPAEWDGSRHQVTPGYHTWVVYLTSPRDVYENPLNDIAMSFWVQPQPAAVSEATLSSTSSIEAVTLRVRFDGDPRSGTMRVYRGADQRPERMVGAVPVEGHEIFFVDREVEAATKYVYRLTLAEGGGERIIGAITVSTPAGVLALHGVRPEPVGDQGVIEFSLPRPGRARLLLYSISGRLERVLLDEDRPAGLQQMTWRREHEASLPSGTYFLRLEAGGERRAARLILLR